MALICTRIEKSGETSFSASRGRKYSEQGEERAAETEQEDTFLPFELQPSIIDVVRTLCPKTEAEEIWRVVGDSLVEQAKDLLDEVREIAMGDLGQVVMMRINCIYYVQATTLLEIWRQAKEEADQATLRE